MASTSDTSDGASTHSDEDVDMHALMEAGQQLVDAILSRAPIEPIKAMITSGAPLWYQDDEGMSALHAAAYVENTELVRLLIDEGAIWNAVDNLHNTAGDVALSLNNEDCYTIIRDAGIRSELLLSLLSSRAPPTDSPLSLVLKATDTSAMGSTDAFLSSRLEYTKDEHGQEICLLKVSDEEEVGVMMGWEHGIMKDTVQKLCADHPHRDEGLKVLNVGFGLGIIDSLFQALPTPPATHVIIEPHPDVLKHMREQGWYDKPGVKILEGKWQDHIESEDLLAIGGFDVVYTDTFSEDYGALHKFFGHVPDLLAGPESRFSFFNGLGATRIDIEWTDVDVFEGEDDRWGKTKEYFAMRLYRLPVGKMRTL